MQAFESLSLDEVMALFCESERLGLVQAASSAYAQGLIEEDAVNWQDALDHYKRACGQDATLEHQQAYARLCWQMGKWDDAVTLLKDILKKVAAEHGRAGNEYATALNNLAMIYHDTGRYSDAEPLYYQALSITRRVLGTDHLDTAVSLNRLAGLYYAQGRYSDAELLFDEVLSIRRRVLGADHPDTAESLNNLAVLYRVQERHTEAAPLLKKAVEIMERVLGRSVQILRLSVKIMKASWPTLMRKGGSWIPLGLRDVGVFDERLVLVTQLMRDLNQSGNS